MIVSETAIFKNNLSSRTEFVYGDRALVSGGSAFHPDGKTFFFLDTTKNVILEFSTSTLRVERSFAPDASVGTLIGGGVFGDHLAVSADGRYLTILGKTLEVIDLKAGLANGGADRGGRLVGGAEADILRGEAGEDTLWGGDGQDTLWGGEGNDRVEGGADFDQINGNQGDDTAWGGDGDDWVVGGKDQDRLYGDAGFDVVYGNLGNDTCYGGDGADWVRGGQGDDIIDGGAGNDWMAGDRGNDTVTGGAGADKFYFFAGAAIDRVTDFSSASGDRVQLDPGQAYTLSYTADGVVVDLGNGDQLILAGVTQASLGDWLFV